MADDGGGDNTQNFFLAFIAVLLLLGAVNYATSGSASSGARLRLQNFQPAGDTAYSSGNTQEASRIKQQVIESNTLASPYRNRVRIESYVTNTNPNQEHIVLTISGGSKDLVPLSGWRVESEVTGRGRPIPNAVILPFPGSINVEQPVFAKGGDRIVLVSGRSPLGYSFKPNICSGYFSRFQTYVPYLPTECPRPETYSLPKRPNHLEDRCLDYLESRPLCFLPVEQVPQDLSKECQTYVATQYSYNSCIAANKGRSDFYKNEWRIYLNSGESLWKTRRETIQVKDTDGRIVTSISY